MPAASLGLIIALLILIPFLSRINFADPTFLNLEYVFYKLYQLLNFIWHGILNALFGSGSGVGWFIVLATIIIIILIYVIIYSHIRGKEEDKKFADRLKVYIPRDKAMAPSKSTQWQKIVSESESIKESGRRLAIIEADVMLEEMLEEKGFIGDTLGEKLKNASPAHFRTVQAAWKGHLDRNKIAHEGSKFELSYAETKEALTHFERSFREFDYI